jgi:acyl carrier protein
MVLFTPLGEVSADDGVAAAEAACRAALRLVGGLARRAPGSSPGLDARLWLVTRGVHGPEVATSDAPAPAVRLDAAALSGLSRVVRLENPGLRCRLVDLDPQADGEEAARLIASEALAGDAEPEVAYRAGRRHAPQLAAVDLGGSGSSSSSEERALALRSDATYLVTGGLGALGLGLARWMVERGARHLVLVGRRAGAGEEPAAVAALRALGAEVTLAAADVADRAQLAAVVDPLRRGPAPLRGVVHAAGVLDDGLVSQQGWERFERVLAPKTRGSWNLHELTADLPLDFFLLFSSAAALLGGEGQGAYATANAFMDGLAWRRRQLGLPAVSLDWGPWAGGGMAAKLGARQRQRALEQGIVPLTMEDGFAALERLLGSERRGQAQTTVMAIRWPQFMKQFAGAPVPRLFQPWARLVPAARPEQGTPLRDLVAGLSYAEARARLLEQLRDRVRASLGLDKRHEVGPAQPLAELGLDSFTAVELRNALSQGAGVKLPATLLFDFPTLQDLAGYLLQQMGLVDATARDAAQALRRADAEIEAEVTKLSEDDLARELDSELEAYGDED